MNRSLLISLAALLAACGRVHDATATNSAPLAAMRVQLVSARSERTATATELTGQVQPIDRAQLAAKLMGTIDEMPFALGQRVRQGDVLVKIGAAEMNARVVQAQSQLNTVQRDLQRERALLEKGASTADLVRELCDRFTAAEAGAREAEVMLGYGTVRAPFDGVIARKFSNVGDLASPGMPLLEIEGNTGFEVEAGIPDSLTTGLSVGATIEVQIADGQSGDATPDEIKGKLIALSSAADPTAHTVTAKIALPTNARVRSGQFVRVLVPGAPAIELNIPTSAITRIGQMERVFIADADNRAILRLVTTGATCNGRTEVLSGIDDGERVVATVAPGLREGQQLRVEP